MAQELNTAPQPSPGGRGGNREKHALNIAIIGGGYAGMAAAVTLAGRAIPVTVFESAKQLGGRARGVRHHNTQLDNGQHILLGCYRQTLHMIGQVGGNIEKDFLRLPLQLALHQRFELKTPHLPAPLHLLAGLLGAKGLTFAQRFLAARFMFAMRRIKFTLPHDGNAHELLRAHKQDDELIRLLWEPICISALNTPVHKASAQVLLNVLRDSLNGARADSDMLLPRLDFSALFPDRAAEYIKQHGGNVFTSCSVESIVPHGDEIELLTADGAQCYSHVICAASPANAVRLFRAVPQLALIAAQIEALVFQPIYTVYLQYPEQVRLPHAMLGFDRCFSQWLFDKGWLGAQHGLIAAVISAEGLHQELEHDQLAQKVAQELREQLGITATPLWHQVIAEKRATFSCEPNLSRPAHITPLSNLLLAGDYTAGDYPATLESAVISGLRCANEILAPGL
ncbi:MAG TPA: hydroxysqualene dehydroxylase HpnE [Gallionellaceae bacterium]|nr:hydroxysqualene dehydroxylase HpnE [Gallionellaceae bacterium]